MLERYIIFRPILDQASHSEVNKLGLSYMLLTENEIVFDLLRDLKNLHQITLKLQDETLTLCDVRTIFDYTISVYPQMQKYLHCNSSIVQNSKFENGLVKLLRKEKLNDDESFSLKLFEVGNFKTNDPCEII
jgi:hypothetical protein